MKSSRLLLYILLEWNNNQIRALPDLMHLGHKTGPLCPIFCIKLKGALFLQHSSRWPPIRNSQLPPGPIEKEPRYKWQGYYVQLPSTGVLLNWSPP